MPLQMSHEIYCPFWGKVVGMCAYKHDCEKPKWMAPMMFKFEIQLQAMARE